MPWRQWILQINRRGISYKTKRVKVDKEEEPLSWATSDEEIPSARLNPLK